MFYLGVMRGSHFQIHTLRKKAIPFSYIRSLFDASLPGEYLSSASLRTFTGFQIIPLRDSEWLPNIGKAIVWRNILAVTEIGFRLNKKITHVLRIFQNSEKNYTRKLS